MIVKKALTNFRYNTGICLEGQTILTKHFTVYKAAIRTRSKNVNCSKAKSRLPQFTEYMNDCIQKNPLLYPVPTQNSPAYTTDTFVCEILNPAVTCRFEGVGVAVTVTVTSCRV